MADTEIELTSRIEVALKRIAHFSEKLSDNKGDDDTSSTLQSELVTEREKTKKLEAELEAARDRLGSADARRAIEMDALGTSLQRSRDELAAVNQINGQLSRRCSELEESLELARSVTKSSDEHKAQIEQLRQERAGDLAEIDTVLRELRPLVEDARDA